MQLVFLDGHCTVCSKSPLVNLWMAAVYRHIVLYIVQRPLSCPWPELCILLVWMVVAGLLPVPGFPIQSNTASMLTRLGKPLCVVTLSKPLEITQPTSSTNGSGLQHAKSPSAPVQCVTVHHKVLTHQQRRDILNAWHNRVSPAPESPFLKSPKTNLLLTQPTDCWILTVKPQSDIRSVRNVFLCLPTSSWF